MVSLPAAIMALAWAASAGAANPPPASLQKAPFDRSHVWHVESDGVLVRGERVDQIRGDASEVVRAINAVLAATALRVGGPVEKGEPGPPTVRLREVRAGTARVDVIGADYLAERMGTTGADDWLAAVTFTLTEVRGVKTVELVFEEGSHASPGNYTRAGFSRYKLVRK